jgi:dTDP-4-dehydrorhamnose reductase
MQLTTLAILQHGQTSTMSTAPITWITGAGGLVGSALVRTAPRLAPPGQVHGLIRAELDLLDVDAVGRLFRKESPALVIHCAALTHTPTCQRDPDLARKLNVDVTARLAELAEDIPLILFSSDLVFDGRTGNYDESAPVNPLSSYARTKAAAEKIVLANPRHTVVRTSLNGGTSPTGDRGFNEQLRRAYAAGQKLRLFTDEFRSPIAAVETARAVWELAAKNQPGLYHVAGAERLSRWQIGQLIAARCPELHPKIEPGSAANYGGEPRAPDTSLNSGKAQKLLSFPLPRFSEWLAEHPDAPF